MTFCRSNAILSPANLIKETSQQTPNRTGQSGSFQSNHTKLISPRPKPNQSSLGQLHRTLLAGKLGGRDSGRLRSRLRSVSSVHVGSWSLRTLQHPVSFTRCTQAWPQKTSIPTLTTTLTTGSTTTLTTTFADTGAKGFLQVSVSHGRRPVGTLRYDQHRLPRASGQEAASNIGEESPDAVSAQFGGKAKEESIHIKKILCLSNGHGEDAIAVAILRALQALAAKRGEPLPIEALPLVGLGGAYARGGIRTIGPAQMMPSGGFLYMDRKQIVGDVRAGLLKLTWQQLTALSEWTHAAGSDGALLAVGDVFPLAMAWLASKYEKARGPRFRKGLPVKYAFVGTAKSEFYVRGVDGAKLVPEKRDAVEKLLSPDCVYLPWERALLSADECVFTAPRDVLTGQVLRTHLPDCVKPRVLDLGNPMMDDVEVAGRPEALSAGFEGFRRVAIVPGSRPPEVHRNFETLLAAADAIAQSAPADRFLFLAPIVPSLDVRPFVDALTRHGWRRAAAEPRAASTRDTGAWGSRNWEGADTVEEALIGKPIHERDPLEVSKVRRDCKGPGEALAGASERTTGCLEVPGAGGESEAPRKALAAGGLGSTTGAADTLEMQRGGLEVGASGDCSHLLLPVQADRQRVIRGSQPNRHELRQRSTDSGDGFTLQEASPNVSDTAKLGPNQLTRNPVELTLKQLEPRQGTECTSGQSSALEERDPGDCWPESSEGPALSIAYTKDGGNVAVLLIRGAFAECAHQAEAGLAMAGTATEQMVGLGKPVFIVPGGGPQFTYVFAEAQSRLLGESVILCPSPEAVGPAFTEVLSDVRRVSAIMENGRRRMGDAGAAARLAEAIWERLLTT